MVSRRKMVVPKNENIFPGIQSKSTTVIDYELEKDGKSSDFLGVHMILRVKFRPMNNDVDHVREESYFIKSCSTDNPSEFALWTMTKEMCIYDIFFEFESAHISLINSVIPKYYFTGSNNHLTLENLFEKGYHNVDRYETLNLNEVRIILESLARIHASSILFEDKHSRDGRCYKLIDEYPQVFGESYFIDRRNSNDNKMDDLIKGILAEIDFFNISIGNHVGISLEHAVQRLCYKIYTLVKPSTKHRNVISHGDLWATNYLIQYDDNNMPRQCKLVDFQNARYVPPAQDVLALLYLTTSRRFREQYRDQLLSEYYTALKNYVLQGGQTFSITFGDFLDSCEEQKVFAVIQTAIYMPVILAKKEDLERLCKDFDLCGKPISKDRRILLEYFKNGDGKRLKRIKDSIEDLLDSCF